MCFFQRTPLILDHDGICWRWLQKLHSLKSGMLAVEAEHLPSLWVESSSLLNRVSDGLFLLF